LFSFFNSFKKKLNEYGYKKKTTNKKGLKNKKKKVNY